jgi:hypothetical protein
VCLGSRHGYRSHHLQIRQCKLARLRFTSEASDYFLFASCSLSCA